MMCAMKLQHEVAYPAPPESVYAMFTDPEFREKVAAEQGVVSVEVALTPRDGAGPRLVVDQVQDTSELPAIARKIVGETTEARVVEDWDGPAGARQEITAPGKPTRAEGSIRLVADGDATRFVVDLEITVKVPLIAGKLEKIMAENIVAGLAVEERVANAWLAGER